MLDVVCLPDPWMLIGNGCALEKTCHAGLQRRYVFDECIFAKGRGMKKHLSVLALIIALVVILTGCDVTISTGGSKSTSTAPASSPPPVTTQFGTQTKTSNCQAHGALPDSACTPGAIFPKATTQQICKAGYASSVRNVPTSEKDQVYAEYGITHHSAGQYEVDHLVSLELGGSNDIANLWPEAASPTPGFHQKDQVENYLHDQVCSGAVSLKDAQHEIATNWLSVYKKMNGG
jgi:hypothetical protein